MKQFLAKWKLDRRSNFCSSGGWIDDMNAAKIEVELIKEFIANWNLSRSLIDESYLC